MDVRNGRAIIYNRATTCGNSEITEEKTKL